MRDRVMTYFVWASALAVVASFLFLLAHVAAGGAHKISLEFFLSEPASFGKSGGISSVLVSTALSVAVCLAAVVPIGLATSVLLAELTDAESTFGRAVRRSLDALAGVPSIVFGLFGNALFCKILGLGFSILAGGLTLACMALPFFVRTAEEGFRAVPREYRSAAASLGVTQTATLIHVLIPAAMPSLIVALVLSIGRALAETAAVIFTSGYVDRMPRSLLDSGRSLSVHIYDLTMNVAGAEDAAYATALVLVVSTIFLNGVAKWCARFWLAPKAV